MKTPALTAEKIKDLRVLMDFLQIYCEGKHTSQSKNIWSHPDLDKDASLCPECFSLMEYSAKRLIYCVQDPKPSCKDCTIHCYAPEQRAKIKEVMRYSGIRLILKGRLGYVLHYLL